MFKVLLLGLLLIVNAAADYEVFVNKSEPFADENITTKEVLFFGELGDYKKSFEEIQKKIVAQSIVGAASGISNQSGNIAKGLLQEGAKAGAAGFGIGLLIGALDPYVMSIYADQYYVELYEVELKNGKKVYMNKFLICDKDPKLSEEEIKKIFGDKK
jgi:hypothetical protein